MTDVIPLQCPDCESRDVEVKNMEGDEPGDEGELECNDCGNIQVVTRVPIDEVFSHE